MVCGSRIYPSMAHALEAGNGSVKVPVVYKMHGRNTLGDVWVEVWVKCKLIDV